MSGFDLGQRLADDLTMTPLEGEMALQWLGDSMAGAVLRARLSGAEPSRNVFGAYVNINYSYLFDVIF